MGEEVPVEQVADGAFAVTLVFGFRVCPPFVRRTEIGAHGLDPPQLTVGRARLGSVAAQPGGMVQSLPERPPDPMRTPEQLFLRGVVAPPRRITQPRQFDRRKDFRLHPPHSSILLPEPDDRKPQARWQAMRVITQN